MRESGASCDTYSPPGARIPHRERGREVHVVALDTPREAATTCTSTRGEGHETRARRRGGLREETAPVRARYLLLLVDWS